MKFFGFSEDKVVYREYYKNCFKDIYKGQKGFLYECEKPQNTENPTVINCAHTCEQPLKINDCKVIDDLYEKFMEYKEDGLFVIKPFENISKQELNFVYDDLRKTILQHDLRRFPDSPMSEFIITHFPEIWSE